MVYECQQEHGHACVRTYPRTCLSTKTRASRTCTCTSTLCIHQNEVKH